jgi:hypothetical protein
MMKANMMEAIAETVVGDAERVEAAIARGMDFLKTHRPEMIVFKLLGGGWGYVDPNNPPTTQKLLERVNGDTRLTVQEYHSVLNSMFKRAQKQLGYRGCISEIIDPFANGTTQNREGKERFPYKPDPLYSERYAVLMR